MSTLNLPDGVEVTGPVKDRYDEILSPKALELVAKLHRELNSRRLELLAAREDKVKKVAAGEDLDFLPETKHIREDDSWKVAPLAPGLEDRRVEMTGPTDRKMVINALNSGAAAWLADQEDANTPMWENVVEGPMNLMDAVDGNIDFTSPEGKEYKLVAPQKQPTIIVRPRGWHLPEKHILVDGQETSGSLVDFALYLTACGQKQIDRGKGPYFYCPKMESHLEARLWNDAFVIGQDFLGIPQGTIRATCLIETYPAAFEMEEILYELREHCSGLNAGRWDYIFSYVRTFAHRGEEFVLPDRDKITMTTPFMRAYTSLLVSTCHKRGAHAIGGPAAVNPTLQDEERRLRALNVVRAEKEREAAEGFDGSWVAHPALVETCRTAYAAVLGTKHDQRDVQRDVQVTADDLISLDGVQQTISLQGVRTNVSVALRYLASWIGGRGAVAIDTLMEDAATVEISRAQLWQWLFHESQLAEGPFVTRDLLDRVVDEEMTKLTRGLDDRHTERYQQARGVLEETAFGEYLPGFFTTYAYVRYLIDRPLRISGPIDKEDIRQSEMVDSSAKAGSAA